MFFLVIKGKKIYIKKIDNTNGVIMGAFNSKKEAIQFSLKNVKRKLETVSKKPPIHFLVKTKKEQNKIIKELIFFRDKLQKMESYCKM